MNNFINKKNIIIILIAICVVAAVFIILLNTTSIFKNKSYQYANTQAEKYLSENKDDKAIAAYKFVIDNNKSIEEKYEAASRIALIYLNNQEYDDAIYWYKEAEKIVKRERYGDVNGVALAAELKGDKQMAIEYYKKAIKLYSSNSPIASWEKDQIKQKIVDLGGQP